RADSARPAFHQTLVLRLKLVEAADAAADDRAAAVGVFLLEVDGAVLDRFDRRDHRELREAVEVADGLGFKQVFGVEVLDLAADVDLEGGRVELLDNADTAPAGADRLPEPREVVGERVDGAHAGNDDAARHFLASSRSMYSMASPTVLIFSACSSGMVISNSSSSSMTSSTMSRESAPMSSMNEVERVTCSLLTPRFSQTMSITRSSTDATVS